MMPQRCSSLGALNLTDLIPAASTDINELDVGPDNELEGNGLEDEKSSSDEFSFLTDMGH